MNRDHALYAIIGILVGFIAGYLLHEVMAARQPAPRTALAAPAPGADGAAADGSGAAGAAGPRPEIEQLRQYVEANPNDADAVLLLANLNFEIQNWTRARDLYTHYLTLAPQDADVMTDLGVCYRETAEYDRALELFRQARSLAPEHWQSLYNEVVVLAFDLNRPGDAQGPLDELRSLQPDNASVTRLAEEIARLRG